MRHLVTQLGRNEGSAAFLPHDQAQPHQLIYGLTYRRPTDAEVLHEHRFGWQCFAERRLARFSDQTRDLVRKLCIQRHITTRVERPYI